MKRGFTLIELVLVLAILSILSMMALRELGRGQSELRWQKSEEVLLDLERAIAGDPLWKDGTVRDSHGDVIATSFLSDCGRLPRAVTVPEDDSTLTLDELFVRPYDVPEYGLYEAAGHLSEAARATCGTNAADIGVYVPMGWRGPYLRTGAGNTAKEYVRDGWGNPFVSTRDVFLNDGVCEARLLPKDFFLWRDSFGETSPEDTCMTNGFPIAAIRHLGADGVEDVTEARIHSVTSSPAFFANRDHVIAFTNRQVLAIGVTLQLRTDWAPGFTPTGYCVRVYGPEPETAAHDPQHGAVRAWQGFGDSSPSFVFATTNLLAGRKIARAWVTGLQGGTTTNYYGVPETVYLHPGTNHLARPFLLNLDRP